MSITESDIKTERTKWPLRLVRLGVATLFIAGSVMIYSGWAKESSIPTKSFNATLALLADGVIDYCAGDVVVSTCGSVYLTTDFLAQAPWIIEQQGGPETLEGLGAAMAMSIARRLDFSSCDGIEKITKRQECIRATVAKHKAKSDVFAELQGRDASGLAY